MNVMTNNNIKCTIALAALQQVIDPEIGLNIVDLGLVYRLDFDDACQKIEVTMTLTTPFCPMGASITHAVEKLLSATFAGEQIAVNLSFDPPWKHDRISEAGKLFLNR